MTQRPFKVGDEIIMTVHTRNNQLPDIGEYKGVVGGIDGYEIEAIFDEEQGMSKRWTFSPTSLENKRWGAEVTIRHADEVSATTKQEWIEGEPGRDAVGIYEFWDSIDKKTYLFRLRGDRIGHNNDFTYYRKISDAPELPPPPPVEEVEAYGMLEAVAKIKKECEKYTGETTRIRAMIDMIDRVSALLSLPATAENKEKYLMKSGKGTWRGIDEDNVNLDEFIIRYKNEYKITGTLIFTAAALEALGVK